MFYKLKKIFADTDGFWFDGLIAADAQDRLSRMAEKEMDARKTSIHLVVE